MSSRILWTLLFVLWASGASGRPKTDPATATPPGVGTAEAVATFSLDEVSRGLTGYGLSVFAGSEPERFEVEVLGVLRNQTPEISYILARLTGQDLERSGVIAGMSGSPVYLDGRLAGAVAFSYLYGLDAIAGITPIDAMRRLSTLAADPPRKAMSAPAGLEIRFEDLVERNFSSDMLQRQIERLRPEPSQGLRTSIQWTAMGFGQSATALLSSVVGDVGQTGAGGGASTGAAGTASGALVPGAPVPAELVPGSAVAAMLVQGDLNLAAHGTVTDRNGDEILALGHPMFSLGPVNLPLAASEVVTVLANSVNSFKIANAGPVIGAFDQDREAGMRGLLGRAAPTTPLSVRLQGLTEREYSMEISNLPQLRPMLFAISTLGAVEAATYSGGFQGLDLEARIRLTGYPDLVARQSFDGDQAVLDSVIFLLGYAAYLEYNPLVEVEIESVEVAIEQSGRPRSAALLAAHPATTRVEPGQRVPVALELAAYRGERYRHTMTVDVPADAPNGRYYVIIGDGSSMDSVRLQVERRSPKTFVQTLDVLRSFHSRRELVTFGLLAAPGLAVGGEVLPDLPGSVRSIFAAGVAPVGDPLSLDIVTETVETLDRPIDGALRIDFEVRRRHR